MKTVQAAGYPPAKSERAIELIVQYASGKEAEAALDELLERLPSSSLSQLIDVYLNPNYDRRSGFIEPDWLEDAGTMVGFFKSKNIEVVDGATGWKLTLPDGTKLTQQYRQSGESGAGNLERGEALARIGLKAAWIVRLRAKPETFRPNTNQSHAV